MMVFSPEFSWRVLGLVPWWCWLLIVAFLLALGLAELLWARAARREAASSMAVAARPAGADDRVVSGS